MHDVLSATDAPAGPQVAGALNGAVVWAVIGAVAIGLVSVLAHRFVLQHRSARGGPEVSVTRPVLAILLVGTLLILAAESLFRTDQQVRNLLIGGVISLSSAAVAFYFATSAATDARKDLLVATGGVEVVPDLKGKTLAQAEAIVRSTQLVLEPTAPPDPADPIKSQVPEPGTSAKGGASVQVFF